MRLYKVLGIPRFGEGSGSPREWALPLPGETVLRTTTGARTPDGEEGYVVQVEMSGPRRTSPPPEWRWEVGANPRALLFRVRDLDIFEAVLLLEGEQLGEECRLSLDGKVVWE